MGERGSIWSMPVAQSSQRIPGRGYHRPSFVNWNSAKTGTQTAAPPSPEPMSTSLQRITSRFPPRDDPHAARGWRQGCATALLGCLLAVPASPRIAQATETSGATPPTPSPLLVDRTDALGVTFRHDDGASGRRLLPEIMGPGVALFDYDGDGDLDLYLVQSGTLVDPATEGAGGDQNNGADPGTGKLLAPDRRPQADRLFRNDLRLRADGSPMLHFTDVTEAVGLDARGYGQGVAIGDVDGNGYPDVYLTNVGPNELWLSDGKRFRRAPRSGTEDARWSTSATLFDADLDGDLDLYVTNYAVWSVGGAVRCFATNSRRDYCGPASYPPERDGFYLNRGDGTFESALEPLLAEHPGAGLGVVTLDADRDGRLDLFVANDGMVNRLWLNRRTTGGFEFVEDGLLAGVAVNSQGQAEASMGVAIGDLDNDLDLDLFLSHLDGETDTLLVQEEPALFVDRTVAAGLGSQGRALTSFGTAMADLDGDLLLDLVVLSGAVRLGSASGDGGVAGLGQPNHILRNLGLDPRGIPRFEAWAPAFAPGLEEHRVSRGLAVGDLDNDGDLDLVIGNTNDFTQVFLNQLDPERWVGVDARGRHGDVAQRVVIHFVLDDDRRLARWPRRDGSYASAADPRVQIVLPEGARIEAIEVRSAHASPDAEPISRLDPVCCGYLIWQEQGTEADLSNP